MARRPTVLTLLCLCLAAPTTVSAQGAAPACPDWLEARAMKAGSSYTCRCPAGIQRHGVYGVFRYAPQSHICTAARHDGRVGLRGGVVTLHFGPGCEHFRQAWRNNVQSRSSTAQPASFAFVRPLPPCTPKPPRRAAPKRSESDDE